MFVPYRESLCKKAVAAHEVWTATAVKGEQVNQLNEAKYKPAVNRKN
ncbi:hypothetical protein GCM10007389_24040 [Pontibacter akesuensis]|nr:hypothetical protein GCM10007389_24040 [Pontibacter akesuensis]